jgi:prophage maintenance system killer protein
VSEVNLYKASDGEVELSVQLDNETVWLTQKQLAVLFDKDVRTVNEHIKNLYDEQELSEGETVRNFRIVQVEGKRQVKREVAHYNLDVIISVGYRVRSKRGTEFRQWATERLKQHIIQGYTLNQERLAEKGVVALEQSLQLLQKVLLNNELDNDLSKKTIALIVNYTKTWHLLLAYDEDNVLPLDDGHEPQAIIPYDLVTKVIATFKHELMKKGEASDLFGREQEHGLESILGNIEQTFNGKALYKSVEERAANLLYFVIKDHPFSDGNKRIASFLFLLYLQQQTLPLNLNDSGLVALALLIAESAPSQKELMVRLIMNLIGT